MNSSFDDFAGSLWDTSPTDALHAVDAYQKEKKMPPAPPPTHKTYADLVLAGVHSCVLAIDTINALDGDPNPRAQYMVAASRKVMEHWGLEVKELPKEERPPSAASENTAGPTDPASTDLSWPPPGSEDPQPPTKIDPATDLVWPPPEPKLPAIYTENFYLPREPFLAWPAHDGPGALPMSEHGTVPINPNTGDKLIFKGAARWVDAHNCWLMRMEAHVSNVTGPLQVWVLSKHIKPGDEIPKVIDASTQARSNDP